MQRWTWAASLLTLAAQAVAQSPVSVAFNAQHSYGPDGPWQAVTVEVGSAKQKIDLYPGGWFETDLISSSICNGQTKCAAKAAGVYDAATANPPVAPGDISRAGFVDQWDAGPETNLSGTGDLMLDTMAFTDSANKAFSLPPVPISLIEQASIMLPNGTSYAPEVGNLALGSPVQTSTYNLTNGSSVTGFLLPGYLFNTSQTPSNSFGLHIGSVPQGQAGSLIFGGYDQSRAVGPVGVYDLGGVAGGEPVVNMIDVSLGVETGSTPFNTTNIGSLYVPGNSHNVSEPMSLNPTVPYMQMPIGTCESVAEFLPVSFDSDLGLYLWNTDDPRYNQITTSAAYMSITLSTTDSDSLTIKVPFTVLDLTLTAPLVSQPTQYWPCKPIDSPDDRYYLGRAFLQAAYLGVNWQTAKFFVAQAAGPDSGPSSVAAFDQTAVTMGSVSSSVFATSWASRWTAVDGTASGLSTAAKIGIVVGAVSFLTLVAVAVYFCMRRRRMCTRTSLVSKNSIRSQISTPLPPPYTGRSPEDAYPTQMAYSYNKPKFGVAHEVDGQEMHFSELSSARKTIGGPIEADSLEIGRIPLAKQTIYR